MTGGRLWTASEDQILRSHTAAEAITLLKGRRTEMAVRSRRSEIRIAPTEIHREWTADEDKIVRSNTIDDAVDLLKSRTRVAVKIRRQVIGVAIPRNRWTTIEDRRIRKTASLPINEALKQFKNRTAVAILDRRSQLGCTRKSPKTPWTCTEIRLLQQIWPSCKRADLTSAFPRHPPRAVCAKARHLGLRKTKIFDPTDLLTQIRLRAHEDGISLKNLAIESGCGVSFLQRRSKKRGRFNFNRLASVVEFFGGRLVIDWRDE